MEYQLVFDTQKYTVKTVTLDNMTIRYRAFEDIVYVKHPLDIRHQCLNIYVPEAFYEEGHVNGYTLKTVPVLLPNGIGGYAPAFPQKPEKNFAGQLNATFHALHRGYVVASPGARGRGIKDRNGSNIGMAPAAIIDLKAAVRYLRFNKKRIPGNVEKIISNGTSAGGALSALLGASGNHSDFEPYLKALGAANEPDNIFAASCYCPITNLEHADMAYEWEFCGINDYQGLKFEFLEGQESPVVTPVHEMMEDFRIALSGPLKDAFPSYLNSLNLKDENGKKMSLDENGSGSFKDFVLSYVIESADKAMAQGQALSGLDWLTIKDQRVTSVDFDGMVKFRTRMKKTPAFDNIDMGTPENELFGSSDRTYRHFTAFSLENSRTDGQLAQVHQIKMMNPMEYIRDELCVTAGHYRIRHGAADRDTSLAISAMLTLMLSNHGTAVDYALPWGVPHSGDYDIDQLFSWIESII